MNQKLNNKKHTLLKCDEIDSAIQQLLIGNLKVIKAEEFDSCIDDVWNLWKCYDCSRFPVGFICYFFCCNEFMLHASWALVIPIGNNKFILAHESGYELTYDEKMPEFHQDPYSSFDFKNIFSRREKYALINEDVVPKRAYNVIKAKYTEEGTRKYLGLSGSYLSSVFIVLIDDPDILLEIEEYKNTS